MSYREDHIEIAPGVYMVPGAAPETGTKLTPERLGEAIRYLNTPWGEQEKVARLEARVKELEGLLKNFIEFFEYNNCDEHLSESGYRYFDRVRDVANGTLPVEKSRPWFGEEK
jgi:hypothetical protein